MATFSGKPSYTTPWYKTAVRQLGGTRPAGLNIENRYDAAKDGRLILPSQASSIAINPDVARRGRMFLGTFDDSVSRNPWGFLQTDTRNLTNTLIYHALLGPRLCARLGNILYHRPYFDALRSTVSPLLALATTGFFQFHMKGHSFNDTVERRQSEKTNSTLDWINETGWVRGSEMYRLLDDLQARAGDCGIRQYSPTFHVLFQELADRAVGEGTPEYREIHAIWTARFGEYGRTRSEFEKLCDTKYGAGSPKKRSAMSTVNSVNHYAYALAMSQITKVSDEIPIVETSELRTFNALTRSLLDSGAAIDAKHLEDLIEGQVFEVIHRNLRVPIDLFHRPESWSKLAKMVGIDQPDDRVLELKRNVLLEIRNALEGGPSWTGPLRLEKACREYSVFLRKELGRPSSPEGSVGMKLGVDFIASAIKDWTADALSEAVKLGIKNAPIIGPAAAGFATGDGIGAGVAGMAGWGFKTFANVQIDLISESAVYHTRRIVDRIRYDADENHLSSRRYFEEHVRPLMQALCVKQITTEALIAAQDGHVGAVLDEAAPDLF